jgi:site-specific recombinase XerD
LLPESRVHLIVQNFAGASIRATNVNYNRQLEVSKMDTQLITSPALADDARDTDPTSIIVPPGAVKDQKHRLTKFADWLATERLPWHKPNLVAYRDYLLERGSSNGAPLASSTVSAHLSTIRSRYADLARDRDRFYVLASHQTDDLLERKAIVDEIVTRIKDATDPATAPVKIKTSQDRADTKHLRLTSAQASRLMNTPGVESRPGLRDTAVIALMLCTGIREAELSALDAPDLRRRLGGELALHVRDGKGCKERLIPYGELEWVLAIVDKWMAAAGIYAACPEPGRGKQSRSVDGGSVFRGFFKGNRLLRPGRLSVRAIQYILTDYPIMVNGKLTAVRPHDLRRTYARRLYEAGVDLVAIQQNMGHADLKTTLRYIGELDAGARRAPAVYEFDLAKLAAVPVQASF